MVAVSALGGIVARELSSGRSSPRGAHDPAPPRCAAARGQPLRESFAQSAHANERPTPARHQRSDRGDGPGHPPAILAGERDPQKLAALKDHRIKASRDVLAKSLRGDWRTEHLFTLQQTHALWQQHRQLIAQCDAQIEQMLQGFEARADVTLAPLPPQTKSSHKKAQRNEPQFAAREECYRVLGVDLTVVPGFATPTVLTLLCELGPEFAEKFVTAKHFGSWLGLCPSGRDCSEVAELQASSGCDSADDEPAPCLAQWSRRCAWCSQRRDNGQSRRRNCRPTD